MSRIVAAVVVTAALVAVSGGVMALDLQPRIVNGITTTDYPTVGILYHTSGVLCSGTIVGCATFLTAAHCVCPSTTDNANACLARGGAQATGWSVFLAQGGAFPVAAVTIDPTYQFGVRGDVAVIQLATSLDGLAPSPINTTMRPALGTDGLIVGFGRTGGSSATNVDFGVERYGRMVTGACVHVPDAANLCWPFIPPVGPVGEDSNTCQGDSGGPMFVDFGAGLRVAGITSGGLPDNCLAEADGESFDTDVFVHRDFIRSVAGSDLDQTRCGTLPQVGESGALTQSFQGTIDATTSTFRAQVEVPAGVTRLRVGLYEQVESRAGPNDFDLYVRAGSPPTRTAYDCRDFGSRPFGFCELESPAAGPWHVLVDRFQGQGQFQLVVTSFATPTAPCAGDCHGDNAVTVDELLLMENIVLGLAPLADCPAGDANGDGEITVDDVLAGVDNALDGCP